MVEGKTIDKLTYDLCKGLGHINAKVVGGRVTCMESECALKDGCEKIRPYEYITVKNVKYNICRIKPEEIYNPNQSGTK